MRKLGAMIGAISVVATTAAAVPNGITGNGDLHPMNSDGLSGGLIQRAITAANEEQPQELISGKLAIVPVQYMPTSSFSTDIFKPSGKGALKGSLGAMDALFSHNGVLFYLIVFACFGDMSCVSGMVLIAIGLGAVGGAGSEGHREVARAPELERIESVVVEKSSQRTFANHLEGLVQKHDSIDVSTVHEAGAMARGLMPNFALLKEIGIDVAMEVSIDSIGLDDGTSSEFGKDCRGKSQKALYMRAVTRLWRVSDERQLFSKTYDYQSPCRYAFEWGSKEVLSKAIYAAHQDITGRMSEVIFRTSLEYSDLKEDGYMTRNKSEATIHHDHVRGI